LTSFANIEIYSRKQNNIGDFFVVN
jgi:hypothetical protein